MTYTIGIIIYGAVRMSEVQTQVKMVNVWAELQFGLERSSFCMEMAFWIEQVLRNPSCHF